MYVDKESVCRLLYRLQFEYNGVCDETKKICEVLNDFLHNRIPDWISEELEGIEIVRCEDCANRWTNDCPTFHWSRDLELKAVKKGRKDNHLDYCSYAKKRETYDKKDENFWNFMVEKFKGKIPAPAFQYLKNPSKAYGEFLNDTLYISVSDEIVKSMLSKPGTIYCMDKIVSKFFNKQVSVIIRVDEKRVHDLYKLSQGESKDET